MQHEAGALWEQMEPPAAGGEGGGGPTREGDPAHKSRRAPPIRRSVFTGQSVGSNK